MEKAIVIDGNSLVYRMFYATYSLSEYSVKNNTTPVNALKLFIKTMFDLLKNNYKYALVAFDHGKKTFRHNEYEDYKSGRKPMPNELLIQLPLIKEALEYLGISVMSKEMIEADDLIGSFAHIMNKNKINVDIFSSDKDMLQLVNEYTNVNLLKTGISSIQIHTLANFKSLNNNLNPDQIVDLKAIVGDKSDHLLGIKGIGLKTCIKLLLKYNHLENIYNNINEINNSYKQKFIDYKDDAYMCKKLAQINIDLFNDINDLDVFLIKEQNLNKLYEMVKKYNINGLDKYFNNNLQLKIL